MRVTPESLPDIKKKGDHHHSTSHNGQHSPSTWRGFWQTGHCSVVHRINPPKQLHSVQVSLSHDSPFFHDTPSLSKQFVCECFVSCFFLIGFSRQMLSTYFNFRAIFLRVRCILAIMASNPSIRSSCCSDCWACWRNTWGSTRLREETGSSSPGIELL